MSGSASFQSVRKSGKHSITVRKTGFQDWVREMNLSGGTINLAAELVPGSTVPAAAPLGQAQSVQIVPGTSEASVADAARRNRAAKEAEMPKDNPPPAVGTAARSALERQTSGLASTTTRANWPRDY
jgi:hypothetical protein